LASFAEHIQQAKRSLSFLQVIHNSINDCTDWQITAAFYSSLHLLNAHIATKGHQSRSHSDLKDLLNPYNSRSGLRLPEIEYTAYVSLQSLSRRARYMVNEKNNNLEQKQAFFIYDRHLAKALRHLDTLMKYIAEKYDQRLPLLRVDCAGFKFENVKYITRKQN